MNNNRWETNNRSNHEINLRARQAQRYQQKDEQEVTQYAPKGISFPVSRAKIFALSSAVISLVYLMIGMTGR
jgi:hypothetical protein